MESKNFTFVTFLRYHRGSSSIKRTCYLERFDDNVVNLIPSETSKKDRFKQILRRFSKDINEFSLRPLSGADYLN